MITGAQAIATKFITTCQLDSFCNLTTLLQTLYHSAFYFAIALAVIIVTNAIVATLIGAIFSKDQKLYFSQSLLLKNWGLSAAKNQKLLNSLNLTTA